MTAITADRPALAQRRSAPDRPDPVPGVRGRDGSVRGAGRGRDIDRGAVGGLEALPFSVLIFVAGSLLLLNVWSVIDVRLAMTSAAREATRTYVEADDPLTGDAAARRMAREAVRAYGRDPELLRLGPPRGDFVRCARVSYTASYPVPAVRLPFLGGVGPGYTVSATHAERFDDLRSGLPGEARCGA